MKGLNWPTLLLFFVNFFIAIRYVKVKPRCLCKKSEKLTISMDQEDQLDNLRVMRTEAGERLILLRSVSLSQLDKENKSPLTSSASLDGSASRKRKRDFSPEEEYLAEYLDTSDTGATGAVEESESGYENFEPKRAHLEDDTVEEEEVFEEYVVCPIVDGRLTNRKKLFRSTPRRSTGRVLSYSKVIETTQNPDESGYKSFVGSAPQMVSTVRI